MVSSTPRPHFTPGKDLVPIVQEAGWAPGPVWMGGKSRPHRDSIPDRPARSQSLYRLSYPAHEVFTYVQLFFNLENHKMWCSSELCTGPLLFNTHITDVPGSADNSSNVTLYADDTGILISNNCYEELNRNFNTVLYNSLKWFQANQLELNMD